MNNYFKQILYDLRHQRMVTITSVMGTAFAIFLVMAVFTISSIDSVPVSPETIRPQLLVGKFFHTEYEAGSSSGNMSFTIANEMYNNLEGIDKISFCKEKESFDASVSDDDCISVNVVDTDENFWDIFDFKFLAGKPFDKAAVQSGLKEVILQKATAINLFGTCDVVNREIKINHEPYIVRGVVENTSPLLKSTYADIYRTYAPETEDEKWMNGYGGNTIVYLVMSAGVKDEDIRSQVRSRYATFNTKEADNGLKAMYHLSPYTSEVSNGEVWSNGDPDTTTGRNVRYAIYTILLVLPAINLSSMTRSRLRRRIAEIGVRRAYGATKWSIFNRFLTENLVLTLAGGIIGLVLSVIFVTLFSNTFIAYGGTFGSDYMMDARPTFDMLLNFKNFAIALFFCLALNLLSTSMPAWRASRVNPAVAISGKD